MQTKSQWKGGIRVARALIPPAAAAMRVNMITFMLWLKGNLFCVKYAKEACGLCLVCTMKSQGKGTLCIYSLPFTIESIIIVLGFFKLNVTQLRVTPHEIRF